MTARECTTIARDTITQRWEGSSVRIQQDLAAEMPTIAYTLGMDLGTTSTQAAKAAKTVVPAAGAILSGLLGSPAIRSSPSGG